MSNSVDFEEDGVEEKQLSAGALARKQKLKMKKKQKKEQRRANSSNQASESENDNTSIASSSLQRERDENSGIEFEYVPEQVLPELHQSDLASHFSNIFEKFTSKQEESADAPEEEQNDGNQDEPKNEDDEQNDKESLSNRQKRRQRRMQLVALKQSTERPDLVEHWDVTSRDPLLLLYLKSYRNAVPVPRHWNSVRRYLQGKRGIDKPPFQLPDFIAATGITQLRSALKEKEDKQKSSQKMRERANPKLGKMEINYRVLHDAFFKYQTKPKTTAHGDLYYEGKEFELPKKHKTPGILSEELRTALGMPEGHPPPFLINMQRYGPPPGYPSLKIPGLNAPLPEGARWGFHPGGWGKPPVDDSGRPLYGDVFGMGYAQDQSNAFAEPIERKRWGELEVEIEEEPQPEEEAPQETEEQAEPQESAQKEQAIDKSGLETPSGLATPGGMETPASLELRKAGLETPETPLELRKGVRAEPTEEEKRELYQVVRQEAASVGGALMGSAHRYILPPNAQSQRPEEKREVKNKDRLVPIIKSQAGQKVDVVLTPDEVEKLEGLNEDVLSEKYEQALKRKAEEKGTESSKKKFKF